ncbi:Undecaprenyl diphosphate synthase [Patellaria atrata CBS 101060]|uniref:Alkyl transferase n=1 Tax=Patellaria atrata CBS 101060 TaxID=1346257 RepID=A0A9P4VS83_9PEZI|nr:Undecaprenyl diphosphate synthase [Patellaria atrata CBS 101060]
MSSLHLSRFRKWILQSPPVDWAIQQLRETLVGALRQGPIPQHVAFVMDGNRRFARSHHIETVEGHNLGFEALARILEVCYKSGVKVVTIYAFSIENFKRSKYEVDALMDMAKVKLSQMAQHGDLLEQYGASIRVLGQKELVKPDVLEAIDRAVSLTAGNKKAILNVCFPYTSRDEITTSIRNTVIDFSKPDPPPLRRPFSESHITRNIRQQNLGTVTEESPNLSPDPSPSLNLVEHRNADGANSSNTSIASAIFNHSASHTANSSSTTLESVQHGNSNLPDPEKINAQTLTDHMFTTGTPPLDLLIRTSGVQRLSDFMLWQCHEETEIVFLDCLWPEFDLWHFLPVLVEWQWGRRKAEEAERSRGRGRGKQIKVA